MFKNITWFTVSVISRLLFSKYANVFIFHSGYNSRNLSSSYVVGHFKYQVNLWKLSKSSELRDPLWIGMQLMNFTQRHFQWMEGMPLESLFRVESCDLQMLLRLVTCDWLLRLVYLVHFFLHLLWSQHEFWVIIFAFFMHVLVLFCMIHRCTLIK